MIKLQENQGDAMLPKGIKNSHDLADLLETTANALRLSPPLELDDMRRVGRTGTNRSTPRVDESVELERERMCKLAEKLPGFTRSEAENSLRSLTVKSIRQLAPLVDVRIPSKATKGEHIEMLLTHLFDAPAGQELISTFHQRNRRKPPAASNFKVRQTEKLRNGKDI